MEECTAQDIEFKSGMIYNHLYDLEEEHSSQRSDYSSGLGYTIALSFKDPILIDSIISYKFVLKYDQYQGHAKISQNSPGGTSQSINTDTRRSTLAIGFYPFCFTPSKYFRINLGLSFDFLLQQAYKNNDKEWTTGKDSGLNNSAHGFVMAFMLEMGYEISLKDNWFIVPQYQMGISLMPDFYDTRSFRNYLQIGVMKRF